jgi:hypothetical protein
MRDKKYPRKTIYWLPEWEGDWEDARLMAIREKTSMHKIIHELLKKEVEKKKRKT